MSFNNELNNCDKLLYYYSSFNMMDIGQVIANIIRIYEGKKYSYQQAYCYSNELHIGSDFVYSGLIIEEESKSKNYLRGNINGFIKDGKVLILVDDISPIEFEMNFYEINRYDNLKECVRFGRFTYVKEFIDEVIEYKIENRILNISKKELEALELKFLISRFREIEENYALRDREQLEIIDKLKQDKIDREKQLFKIMNKS